jgi:ubiquinone/menaquinone biosynthesis C-methylase UbiE
MRSPTPPAQWQPAYGGIGIAGLAPVFAVSFDALAPHYRWMEFVLAGEKLQRCRTAFLDEIPAARNILLVGEGHGRCLVECYRRFASARVVCVDASEQMLAQARRQLAAQKAGATRVEFIHADILDWSPSAKAFDLIATNFFLDCFRAEQLERIICRLAAAAAPGSSWLLADFQIPSGGLKRIRSRLILWAMYAFFRTTTRLPANRLTPPDSFLNREGFLLHRRVEAEWGLLRSDWWQGPGESANLT